MWVGPNECQFFYPLEFKAHPLRYDPLKGPIIGALTNPTCVSSLLVIIMNVL